MHMEKKQHEKSKKKNIKKWFTTWADALDLQKRSLISAGSKFKRKETLSNRSEM